MSKKLYNYPQYQTVSGLSEVTHLNPKDLLSISQVQPDQTYISKKIEVETFAKYFLSLQNKNIKWVIGEYHILPTDSYLLINPTEKINILYLPHASDCIARPIVIRRKDKKPSNQVVLRANDLIDEWAYWHVPTNGTLTVVSDSVNWHVI